MLILKSRYYKRIANKLLKMLSILEDPIIGRAYSCTYLLYRMKCGDTPPVGVHVQDIYMCDIER